MDRLAIIANNDISYKRMVDHIINSTPSANIETKCELKNVEGSITDLSIYMKEEGHNWILKNGQEVPIPMSEQASCHPPGVRWHEKTVPQENLVAPHQQRY